MAEDMTDRLNRMLDDAAERLYGMRKKLREATGDRPWGSVRLTPQEKLERFAAIWDDAATWTEAIEAERRNFNLGPGQVFPKRLLQEAAELAARLREREGAAKMPSAAPGWASRAV